MLVFVQACNSIHYMAVYVSEHKVIHSHTNILYRNASVIQAPENPPTAHRNTPEHLHTQHPPRTGKLAECNYSSFQKDEEGRGQADTRACRGGSEP